MVGGVGLSGARPAGWPINGLGSGSGRKGWDVADLKTDAAELRSRKRSLEDQFAEVKDLLIWALGE